MVAPAQADVAGLTPCSESKAFQKRQKKTVKDLQKRMKKVRITPTREISTEIESPCSPATRGGG